MSSHAKRRSSRRRHADSEQDDDYYRSCRDRKGTPFRWGSSHDASSSRSSSRSSSDPKPDSTRPLKDESPIRPTLLTSHRRHSSSKDHSSKDHSSKDHRRSQRTPDFGSSDFGSSPTRRRSSEHRRSSLPSPELDSNDVHSFRRRSSETSHSSRRHRRSSSTSDLGLDYAAHDSRKRHRRRSVPSDDDCRRRNSEISLPDDLGKHRRSRRSSKTLPLDLEIDSTRKHHRRGSVSSENDEYKGNRRSSLRDSPDKHRKSKRSSRTDVKAHATRECRENSSSSCDVDHISRKRRESDQSTADITHMQRSQKNSFDAESQSAYGSAQSTPAPVKEVAEDTIVEEHYRSELTLAEDCVASEVPPEMEERRSQNWQHQQDEAVVSDESEIHEERVGDTGSASDSQAVAARNSSQAHCVPAGEDRSEESECEHGGDKSPRKGDDIKQDDLVVDDEASSDGESEHVVLQQSGLKSKALDETSSTREAPSESHTRQDDEQSESYYRKHPENPNDGDSEAMFVQSTAVSEEVGRAAPPFQEEDKWSSSSLPVSDREPLIGNSRMNPPVDVNDSEIDDDNLDCAALRNYASAESMQLGILDPAMDAEGSHSPYTSERSIAIYRRANCRYTKEGHAAFAGILGAPFQRTEPLFGSQDVVTVLEGNEATHLSHLLRRADGVLSAPSRGTSEFTDFSEIVLPLSSAVATCMQKLLECGTIDFFGAFPAVLALFVPLVELLDLHATNLSNAGNQKVSNHCDFLTSSVAEAEPSFYQFMSLCMHFVQGSHLDLLKALGASDLASELELHAFFAISLQPPQTTPGHPCETLLLEIGHSALSAASIAAVPSPLTLFEHLVRLSIALDALRLGLQRSRSTAVENRSRFKFTKGQPKMVLTPLALLAIEALDKMPSLPRVTSESAERVHCDRAAVEDSVIAAAIRLLATIGDMPGATVGIPLRDTLSSALAKRLSARSLTTRIIDALHKLVHGRRPLGRFRAWFRHQIDVSSEIHKACVMADIPTLVMRAARTAIVNGIAEDAGVTKDERGNTCNFMHQVDAIVMAIVRHHRPKELDKLHALHRQSRDGEQGIDPALFAKLDSLRDAVRTMSVTGSSFHADNSCQPEFERAGTF